MSYGDRSLNITAGGVAGIAVAVLLFVVLGAFGCPHYNVWQQGLAGEAELKRAEQNRQIAVQEADAKLGAAKLLAQGEIERAKGVAEANKIIAEGLGGPEGYLRWLWIDAINNPNKGQQIIYIPTEAGLPILEAGRKQ
jgi:regulator of protease activity HflC (stomatin/prohibitin superfamily)